MTSRRRALRAGMMALAGLAGLPGRSFALRIEEDEGSPRARLLFATCEARSAHERLIAELIADLEAAQGRTRAVETVRGMDCPLCGCRLGLAMPGEPEPPRF